MNAIYCLCGPACQPSATWALLVEVTCGGKCQSQAEVTTVCEGLVIREAFILLRRGGLAGAADCFAVPDLLPCLLKSGYLPPPSSILCHLLTGIFIPLILFSFFFFLVFLEKHKPFQTYYGQIVVQVVWC